MKEKLLLLTLNTFSATGGIEKVCRVAGKALHETATESGGEAAVYSMYDSARQVDERYFPKSIFKAFGGSRLKFVLSSVRKGRDCDVVILSHINLLAVGYLIKKISPKAKLVLIAHGIEVWNALSGVKTKMLRSVDLFLPVSSYTAGKLQKQHNVEARKIKVLNNCLDPYLKAETSEQLKTGLRQRYGISEGDFVLLTVTRLKHSEQYKGYDKVVEAMAKAGNSTPNLKYLIVGKYDEEEKNRLDAIVAKNKLSDNVIYVGFAKDEELSAHFGIADCYIMPSTGEGFGIVFIEALFYGLPVIAGNVDGSVDALGGGEFGMLVNPNNLHEIDQAIQRVKENKSAFKADFVKLMQSFGYDTYKSRLKPMLTLAKKTVRGQVREFASE